jgi:hypothetical protein
MLLRILAAIAWLTLMASPAAWSCACSQAPPGTCHGMQQSDVVFLGTVTAIEEVPYVPAPEQSSSAKEPGTSGDSPATPPAAPKDTIAARLTRYHFRIDERFASPDSSSAEIDIFSGGNDGDCGYHFKADQQYVVYTHQGADGRLFSTICDGTRPASDAHALLPQLRAMRDGRRVASVFGEVRRADPPFLTSTADPDDPMPNVPLKLRSHEDRFETSTDGGGIYTFYDVHAGEYSVAVQLPPGAKLTGETSTGELPSFTIPDGACFEYDVNALPTGHIQGSVLGPDGKPLDLASLELYRAGNYSASRPGLWAFQGAEGTFDFDHIGPGDYILVFNRANRMDPNAPFKRAFYPGVAEPSDAQIIHLDDGQQLSKVIINVSDRYPSRRLLVKLEWEGPRPPGDVSVTVKADNGQNPAAEEVRDGLYELPVLESANYTISAWEDLAPGRVSPRRLKRRDADCPMPARLDAPEVSVAGSDVDVKKVTLTFPKPTCGSKQR